MTGGRHNVKSLMSCLERRLSLTLASHPDHPRASGPAPTASAEKPDRAACTQMPRPRVKSKDRQKETKVTGVGSGCPRGGGWWELSGEEPAGIFRGDGMFSTLPWMVDTGVYA